MNKTTDIIEATSRALSPLKKEGVRICISPEEHQAWEGRIMSLDPPKGDEYLIWSPSFAESLLETRGAFDLNYGLYIDDDDEEVQLRMAKRICELLKKSGIRYHWAGKTYRSIMVIGFEQE